MKKLLLIPFIFIASGVLAGGPIYHHKESEKQLEFENAYKDISTVKNASLTKSSATATYVTIAGSQTLTGFKNLKGTGTNDSAPAGYIGEYVSSKTANAFVPGASNTYYDILALVLTAGDWDVTALVYGNTGSSYTDVLLGISQTSGNSSAGLVIGDNRVEEVRAYATGGTGVLSIPNYRVSISATTTLYMKYLVLTSGSLFGAYGRISARRMR